MAEHNPELARFSKRLWTISSITSFLVAVGLAFALKAIGIPHQTISRIAVTVLFAPLAIVSIHGFIRGYWRTNTTHHIVRGSMAVIGNMFILSLYAAIVIVAWLKQW